MSTDTEQILRALARLGDKVDELRLTIELEAKKDNPVVDFQWQGKKVSFFLPMMNVDAIQRRIALRRCFYEDTLLTKCSKYLDKDSVVFDCGAHIGNHTLHFALINQVKKVVSFEPQATVFENLEKNVKLNGLRNVVLKNMALGEKDGFAEVIAGHSRNSGGTEFAVSEEEGVRMDHLDKYHKYNPTFMKIDVEGMALPVLKGAKKILTEAQPVLWVELRPARKEFDAPAAFLQELGYRHSALNPQNHLFLPPG